MNNATYVAPPIVFVLAGMAVIWFVLIKILLKRLETKHPAKYESMGKPSLFLRNTPGSVTATLKFIAFREHRSLGDVSLSRLSDAMMAFFAAYLAVFAWIILNVPVRWA